ncbi:phage portal protein [Desulfovibrio sp. OttesenSCG-928-G11]|nr:phage portal protein [Desulfovibrio sp. OttesenSCG-928-G11]
MSVLSSVANFFGMGRPLTQDRVSTPSRDSGALRGTVSNWRPRRVRTQAGEDSERRLTQDRAADLYANDFAARSAIDSISTNAVGTGLVPQPRIPYKLLGITEDEAVEFKEQQSWLWSEWCAQAHAAGTMHFEDLQLAAIKSALRLGEMTHLPVMDDPTPENSRSFSLAIQPLSPRRLRTPSDKESDPSIRDGVQVNGFARPLGYWIAAPRPTGTWTAPTFALSSADFRYIPARIGHRPGFFHLFRHDEEEQTRGVSSLSTGVKLFRNMGDAIDHELLAQVLAASFPVFIGLEGGRSTLPPEVMEQYNLARPDDPQGKRYYQEYDAGTVMYGNENEKPHILESKRPGQNFMGFMELILRAVGASLGIPYEVLFKDFSKTNYSSARAALNEAWKIFQLYRHWFARLYCQPIWNMVMEEAYLRGRLVLPASARKGFYEARLLWCNAYWYGPSRGYVDPVKEIQANLLAIANRLMTRTEHWAQNGGDFYEGMEDIEAEERRLAAMPTATPVSGLKKSAGADQTSQKDDDADSGDDDDGNDADDDKSGAKEGDDA